MTIILNGTAGITFPDGTTQVDGLSTPVPVADGGTGAATLTANNVILGNGTSAVQVVAPGTNGNVLTSNGTTWTSAAAPAGYTNANALSLFNASGSAPVYACRAWVNFNGSGTVSIRASGNVSSISDNGTGQYQINFTTAMQDANYSLVSVGFDTSSRYSIGMNQENPPTTTTAGVGTKDAGGAFRDFQDMYFAVFR